MAESRGYIMKEDSEGADRLSFTKTHDIVEKDAIISMVNSGNVVIAGRGGISSKWKAVDW